MTGTYHKWHSPRLGQTFEVKTYGTRGRPMLVFPSSEGRFYDYENFGMTEVCRPWIEAGTLRVVCVDGRDAETWANHAAPPADRARRYEAWEACVLNEVLPLVRATGESPPGGLIVTGCSLGAYHAAHFLFQRPELCDAAILLSGIYSLAYYFGDGDDPDVRRHEPLHYLPVLADEARLAALRKARIILCCGQGAYEEECLAETTRLASILTDKGVPHWLDLWGHDVSHDWPWWRKQLAYFLGHLGL